MNRKFAGAVVQNTDQSDYVWVQDYHLILVSRELKRLGARRDAGFFLHIPFPPLDIFLKLPWRFEILEALLEYDLIGFQTVRDLRNFIGCVRALLSCKVTGSKYLNRILLHDREVLVGAFPISIDYDEFESLARTSGVADTAWIIHANLPRRQLILGVDRLDYTKGIPERLLAFGHALARYPDMRRKVNLVQVVVPSRGGVEEYGKLKQEIERLVGEINGRYTDVGWTPIHYIYRSLPRPELVAYYKTCEIALITPLKDGMNLIRQGILRQQHRGEGGPDPERIRRRRFPAAPERPPGQSLRPAAYRRRDPHRLPHDPRRTAGPDAEAQEIHPEERHRQLGQFLSPGGHRPGPAGLSPARIFRPLSEWRSGARGPSPRLTFPPGTGHGHENRKDPLENLTPGAYESVYMKRFIIALLVLLAIPEGAAWAMTYEDERTVARDFINLLEANSLIVHDAEITWPIQMIAEKLADHVREPIYHFTVHVVRDRSINAFTIPDGHIFVNLGLLLFAQDLDEVAAVIGHEMGHGQLRHIPENYDTQFRLNTATILGVLAGTLLSSKNPEAGAAMIFSSLGGTENIRLAFSRQHEFSADEFGRSLLKTSSIDPSAMPRFLVRLNAFRAPPGSPNTSSPTPSHPEQIANLGEDPGKPAPDAAYWTLSA